MDIRLTQEEADDLIGLAKESLLDFLHAPSNRESIDFDVRSINTPDKFIINIFCGKNNSSKINYGARIAIKNIVLLELHISPSGKHRNPDGQVISGSHWHIYREGYDTQFAFPAADITDPDFVKSTTAFLQKFNVIKMPEITQQMEI